jgi:cobalt-precorrin-5B (C1)-methyltransferase
MVTISIPGGVRLAEKTMNAGSASSAGCRSWGRPALSCRIHVIMDTFDPARDRCRPRRRAQLYRRATDATSECAVQRRYDLPSYALIDIDDFAGGVLKYLRAHPVERLTLAGGFAKFAKFAQGRLDLHSARSRVDVAVLAGRLAALGGDPAALHAAAGAGEVRAAAGTLREPLAGDVARRAREVALATLSGKTAVAIVDRGGEPLARVSG